MSDLTVAKVNLSRLLSQEDILVEQRNTKTAYFDVKNRTLVIPTLKKNLSKDLIDLFISHETAHALFTKEEDWAKIKEEKLKVSIVNCVEDARVERLIKQKYPGLKSVHSRAYKELMDIDFFGLRKIDIETINLADKINLYCKVGFLPFINFNEKEKSILDKVENTQTFEQVLEVSRELQEYLKEEIRQQLENDPVYSGFDKPEYGEGDEKEEDEEYNDTSGSSERFADEESEDDSGEISDSENDFNESDLDAEIENELESLTDTYSNMNIQELFSEDTRESIYVDMPEIDLKDYVLDYKTIYGRIKKESPDVFLKDFEKYNAFRSENASVVSYLVKEFNLKKNAQGRRKVKESKTGDINLTKVYSYKFNNDIFKRSAKVPGEKNHCMVFFVDWSASMDSYIKDTIKQLLCLVMFCKKLNIPYEVYAFTSNYYEKFSDGSMPKEKVIEDKVIDLQYLKLMNILSYRMSNNEFIAAANVLLSYGSWGFIYTSSENYYKTGIYMPQWFKLGNTPLNHAIILSDKVASQLKEKTKTDIVNIITMSDGESHSIIFKHNGYKRRLNGYDTNVHLRDKNRKISQYIRKGNGAIDETNSCVDFIKQFNDYRYFGLRLISQKEFRHDAHKFIKKNPYDPIHLSNFKKDNALRVEGTSFDDFYFVKANTINKFEEEISITEKETVTAIAKKFNKALSSRLNNRTFLKKFISFIS